MIDGVTSWNRIPRVRHARVLDVSNRHASIPALSDSELCIAYGNGRSYGDVCLNGGNVLLKTRGMDHFIDFDRATGRLVCEAGVLLSEVLDLVVPQGWFLPVTPGTRFVTVAGAVANDVHGKNHHAAGSFGHHVVGLELVRSDGERILCGPDLRSEWFAATVGGLGLTGLITRVELQLASVANAYMVTQAMRFRTLDEFWLLNDVAEHEWPYTVAWVDCTAPGGRGILYCGRHASSQADLPVWKEARRTFPIDTRLSLINKLSLNAFNFSYFRRPLPKGNVVSHYVPYFYPLDALREWNRIYGARGFYQYQCVLPPEHAKDGIAELLRIVARSGMGSFLSTLKMFGSRPSLGMMSFSRPGATLALDFPDAGARTNKLFADLDAVVRNAGGALYAAKDARMSPETFRAGYPSLDTFSSYVDPRFSSGFWRRVTES